MGVIFCIFRSTLYFLVCEKFPYMKDLFNIFHEIFPQLITDNFM